jgi:hypothetical protein
MTTTLRIDPVLLTLDQIESRLQVLSGIRKSPRLRVAAEIIRRFHLDRDFTLGDIREEMRFSVIRNCAVRALQLLMDLGMASRRTSRRCRALIYNLNLENVSTRLSIKECEPQDREQC